MFVWTVLWYKLRTGGARNEESGSLICSVYVVLGKALTEWLCLVFCMPIFRHSGVDL